MSVNDTQVNATAPNFYAIALPVYVVAVPSMITLCAVAVLANLIILASVKSMKQQLSLTLKVTYSLAGADAWSSMVILCGLVANSYIPYVMQRGKFYRQDCWAYSLEALRLGAMLTSVLHLLWLAFNHYFATAYPIKYRVISTKKVVNWLILLTWICPPAFYMLIFFTFSEETFNAPVCSTQFVETISFRGTVFFLICIPLLAMTFIYILIAAILSKLHRELRSDRNAGQRQRSSLKRKTKTFFTALLIVSTFLIGWVPSIVLLTLTCDTCAIPKKTLHRTAPRLLIGLSVTVNLLIIIKGLLNPLIYGLRIPEISRAVRHTYCPSWNSNNDSVHKSMPSVGGQAAANCNINNNNVQKDDNLLKIISNNNGDADSSYLERDSFLHVSL